MLFFIAHVVAGPLGLALFDHFRTTHVSLCRRRRQAHRVDLGPHLELLAEHDHGDIVVQRDVVELRVNVDLLGAVRSETRTMS